MPFEGSENSGDFQGPIDGERFKIFEPLQQKKCRFFEYEKRRPNILEFWEKFFISVFA